MATTIRAYLDGWVEAEKCYPLDIRGIAVPKKYEKSREAVKQAWHDGYNAGSVFAKYKGERDVAQ